MATRVNGYTLLELMVVTAVIGVLVIVATTLFLSTTKGGSKVQVTTEINQNGELVIGTIERLIRNAYGVSSACAGEASASLSLVDRYGQSVTLSCENVGSDNGYIASNGARLTTDKLTLTSCSFTCTQDDAGFRSPLVRIDFELRQAQAEALPGETGKQRFATSVSPRNY